MKILNLRFKNLNSLAGEWNIDFTHTDYSSSGLFAITGPTGAGKSTILDAICLALYGQTPRLSKITPSSNEIMTRQTGECFAEVEFQSQDKYLLCHWSQNKARGKADGRLQPAKHEFVNLELNTPLSTKLKEVPVLVEKHIGMDFDRFTRAMLLAQGAFASFLQAGPDERSPLLEKITGTTIYSQISQRVHERFSLEEKKLKELQKNTEQLQVLNQEQEQEIINQYKIKEAESIDQEKVIKNFNQDLQWIEYLEQLEEDLIALEKQKRELNKKESLEYDNINNLEKAKRALQFETAYNKINFFKKDFKDINIKINKSQKILEQKQKKLNTDLEQQKKLDLELEEEIKNYEQELILSKEVKELDQQLAYKDRTKQDKEKDKKSIDKKISDNAKKLEHHQKNEKKYSKQLSTIEQYLYEHPNDALLQEKQEGIEIRLKEIQNLQAQILVDNKKLVNIQKEIEAQNRQLLEIENKDKNLEQSINLLKSEIENLSSKLCGNLQDKDIEYYLSQKDILQNTNYELQNLQKIAENQKTSHDELQKTEKKQQDLITKTAKAKSDTENQQKEVGIYKELVASLRDQVQLLSQISSLREKRAQLLPGNPCPLCGSKEHPFTKNKPPKPDETSKKLQKQKKNLENAANKLNNLQKEYIHLQKDLEQANQQQTDLQQKIKKQKQLWDENISKINIDNDLNISDIINLIKNNRDNLDKYVEIINICKNLDKKINIKQKKLYEEQNAKISIENNYKIIEQEIENLKNKKIEIDTEQQQRQKDEILKTKDTRLELDKFKIKLTDTSQIEEIIKTLKQARDSFKKHQDKQIELKNKIYNTNIDIEKYNELISENKEELKAILDYIQAIQKDIDDIKIKRSNIYADKNPDLEQDKKHKQVENIKNTHQKYVHNNTILQTEINNYIENINQLQTDSEKATKNLIDSENNFVNDIQAAGFKDELDFLQSRLSHEDIEKLQQLQNEFIKNKTQIETRQKDKQEQLEQYKKQQKTGKSKQEIRSDLAQAGQSQQKLQQEIGVLQAQLNHNKQLKAKHQEQIEIVSIQEQECLRWQRLNRLIGSHDGKKFRNFAQSLTFEGVIAQANRQLANMTDRYLLVPSPEQPLELSVVDNYQAGEVRSVKNLSGGESFLISLGLALGLSAMNSRNIQVDSLFLDEGFGSLDEKTLESALEALAGLHQHGKLIGIISHVPAIKNRIPTRIQVIKSVNGKSRIEAPGCRSRKSF